VFQFEQADADQAWMNYLLREALIPKQQPVAHEADRRPVLAAEVDDIADRQALGLIPADLDPALFRLLAFALSNYPRVLPQIIRITSGANPGAKWQLPHRLKTMDEVAEKSVGKFGQSCCAGDQADDSAAHGPAPPGRKLRLRGIAEQDCQIVGSSQRPMLPPGLPPSRDALAWC
jgi:hypothetical protein